ncbi:EcsC family protein [Bacillus sp. DJP31]|uniref:EcsC family protein n=1 Tax=Bacillus sp. DJP31 TaxID=3409789 RepID=UPI003BB6EE98
MLKYEGEIYQEAQQWKKKLIRKKSMVERLSKSTQKKLNSFIPKKAHEIVTESIKQMVEMTLNGSNYLPAESYNPDMSIHEKEQLIHEKLLTYKRMAAIEGAGTGAGGILLALADFPLLLGIKMRFLFEIGSIYGLHTKNYDERLFILYVFQLAFSSEEQKGELLSRIEHWDKDSFKHEVNWQQWQQDYRDYIDLVKLLQLVPGIGAVVGAIANYHLLDHLGETAIQCYRLRLLKK